ncbi:MAG: class I SAM-dependent methyltransferase [Verrucomicrobiota bacterium]
MIKDLFRAVGGCSPVALWALATRGPAVARKVIGGTLATLWPKQGAPVMSFWDIVRAFPVDEELIIHAGSWQDGCTAPLERFVMAQLLHFFKPKKIVEVGTYRGTTTRLLLDNLSPDARIFTIDLPLETDASSLQAMSDERLIIHRKVGAEYHPHPRREAVTQILGDTFDPKTWEQVPDGIDFVFIDASHSYEAVRNDTEKVWPKLTENAVILWHDYTESVSPERGVGRYIRELMETKEDVFVCAATDMAIRIPQPLLAEGAARVPGWHPSGDYFQRNPRGPLPWQSKSNPGKCCCK